jgi:hypothetical protein
VAFRDPFLGGRISVAVRRRPSHPDFGAARPPAMFAVTGNNTGNGDETP